MPFVDVASPRIDYRRIGTACAHSPTLVFPHEGLGSVARWRDFPDRVAPAANCDAVVYSRYGYGNSNPLAEPRTARYQHDEALIALPDFFDRLSIVLIPAGAAARPVTTVTTLAAHVMV